MSFKPRELRLVCTLTVVKNTTVALNFCLPHGGFQTFNVKGATSANSSEFENDNCAAPLPWIILWHDLFTGFLKRALSLGFGSAQGNQLLTRAQSAT